MNIQNEILSGLMQTQKSIDPKFLYDERGSELFEKICTLEEYYPVRAETEILQNYASEMAGWIGKEAIIIEPGCGNCQKVRFLLEALQNPKAYVALDISGDFLFKTARGLEKCFPEIPVYPVIADYTQEFSLPQTVEAMPGKRVIFFPGSTIGNLHPSEAKAWLKRMIPQLEKEGGLLISVDLKKDSRTLELAYDDPSGVTAEFNFNLLDRLNREFSASLHRENFEYQAIYNERIGRVEMFLVSRSPQSIQLGNQTIRLQKNEKIHTENSYKYLPQEFIALVESTGFQFRALWTDAKQQFCSYYFERD